MNEITADQKLRAAQSALSVSGSGILCLAGWGIIKVVLSFLYASDWEELRAIALQGGILERVVCIILFSAAFSIYAALYLYISTHAIAEGHGKHRSILYIILSAVLAGILIVEILVVTVSWWHHKGNLMYLSDIPVEVITLAADVDLIVNAVRIRRYAHQSDQKDGETPCR